jgi:hypothetical protein
LSIEKAKRRVQADRSAEHTEELLRVLDRAVLRVQKLRQATRALPEPRKVLFIDMKKTRLLK